jgi:hypothetical protein
VTLHPSATEATVWRPCSNQEHLDELRVRYEDAVSQPYDRDAKERLSEAVGGYLDHLDGKHRDDCPVLTVRVIQEPDRYERERMGVWE